MKPRLTLVRWVGGLVLIGLGGVATSDLLHAATERILPGKMYWLIESGPGLALLGLLVLLRGFASGRKVCSRRNVLLTGLVMLAACAVAWLWVMATDHGGDASWANGMIAIIASIFVGLPGLLLMLGGLLIRKAQPECEETTHGQ